MEAVAVLKSVANTATYLHEREQAEQAKKAQEVQKEHHSLIIGTSAPHLEQPMMTLSCYHPECLRNALAH